MKTLLLFLFVSSASLAARQQHYWTPVTPTSIYTSATSCPDVCCPIVQPDDTVWDIDVIDMVSPGVCQVNEQRVADKAAAKQAVQDRIDQHRTLLRNCIATIKGINFDTATVAELRPALKCFRLLVLEPKDL
jgi:hypothetical protein